MHLVIQTSITDGGAMHIQIQSELNMLFSRLTPVLGHKERHGTAGDMS